ncbi:MAG TPA: hypothetical protein VF765_11865 [Polyangiaceae bacterium]
MIRHIAGLAAVCSLAACAAPASTIPAGHMSASAEQQAAAEHERAAGVLEAQALSNPTPTRCGPLVAGEPEQICWSVPRLSDAAVADLQRASAQRDAAAEHRRTSAALVAAEARACVGVSEADMAESPFAHRADIVAVDVIEGSGSDGAVRPLGARVRFHEVGHLTAAALQHLVDCHIARDDALGHDVPEMGYCPLVPRGATATVEVIPHGYIVEIRSNDPAGAREIARRATALLP